MRRLRRVGRVMASAIVATAYGGPEVLAPQDVDVGPPGPGQVLVEVRAAGVNPVDYKLYSGVVSSDPTKLPMRLGFEASGQVKAVGEGAVGPVGPLHPGDEVITYPVQGAYAAELVARAESVLPKPAAMSFEQASGLMLTGVTAFHALSAAKVGAGDTVIIHGAAGGVGLMAVQLAVDRGARVIGTASENGHAYLRQMGAEPVLYGPGLVERVRAVAPDGVDAAIDTVGTDEAVDTSRALVADRDRIVSIAAFKRGRELGIKLIGQGPGADPGTEIRAAARLELLRLVEEDKLRVVVAAIYPLSEAADAHRALMSGHTHGKIALVP
jgi:NADPH:quinone reductase